MSPEQLHGEAVDGRADLWALGVVLYEMLCGRRPFDGDNSGTVIAGILHRDPEPLERLRTGLPEGVATLVHVCLEKDRERRPADAAAVLRALEGAGSLAEPEDETRTFAMPAVAADESPAAARSATGRRRLLPAVAAVVALSVAMRRREFGVRLAVGATAGDVPAGNAAERGLCRRLGRHRPCWIDDTGVFELERRLRPVLRPARPSRRPR